VRRFIVPILSRTVFPGLGQRRGSALVRAFAVIAVALAVLMGLASECSHTSAGSAPDECSFGSAPEDGAENGAAGASDESAFAGADASLTAVVVVAAAIIVVVVSTVALCSAIKVVVVLGQGSGC
jgi:hypothetical protein